jgi:hypothetical protein
MLAIPVLVGFAVFFACCVAQFWLSARVRRSLVHHHPEEFRKLSDRSLFMENAILRFCWTARHKALNDPFLTRRVMQMRLLSGVAFFAWAVFFVSIITGHAFSSAL